MVLNEPQGIIIEPDAATGAHHLTPAPLSIWTRNCDPPPTASVSPVALRLTINPVPVVATVPAVPAAVCAMFHEMPTVELYEGSGAIMPVTHSAPDVNMAGVTVPLLAIGGPANGDAYPIQAPLVTKPPAVVISEPVGPTTAAPPAPPPTMMLPPDPGPPKAEPPLLMPPMIADPPGPED